MKVQNIVDRARNLLNDQDGTRWLDSELVNWINDAQKFIAIVRPDASVSNSVMTLASGTKQALPSGGFRLLDVIRNMATDGVTPSRAIRYVDREVLDSQDPYWHTTASAGIIKHYIYDDRNPTVFYVYPAATSTMKIELMYSIVPTEIVYNTGAPATTLATDLTIVDIYLEAVVNYVMFRAYSKDAEFSSNKELAQNYFNLLNAMLGIKTKKDVAYSPELNSKGAWPDKEAVAAGGV